MNVTPDRRGQCLYRSSKSEPCVMTHTHPNGDRLKEKEQGKNKNCSVQCRCGVDVVRGVKIRGNQ